MSLEVSADDVMLDVLLCRAERCAMHKVWRESFRVFQKRNRIQDLRDLDFLIEEERE